MSLLHFLARLRSLVGKRAHSALDRAESPDEKLRAFLSEVEVTIGELQSAVTGAVVEEKKLQRSLESQLDEAKKWDDRAVLALNQNDEELARGALVEKRQVLAEADRTKASLIMQQTAVADLKNNLVSAKKKLDDAKRQYQLALARYKSAEAKAKLAEISLRSGDDSPLELLDELDGKILRLEAEAECRLEAGSLESSFGSGRAGGNDDLESRFRLLEEKRDSGKKH